MNATPRPWAATSNGEIIGADTNEVAITKNWGNEELCNANAELIVRAVNSYDAMREALEEIRAWITPKYSDTMTMKINRPLADKLNKLLEEL